ncbi:MAG: methionyl-tRNA formyltransferase [Thermomicrobiales bacterium]
MTGPRLIYIGMFSMLSRAPLAALLDAGADVRAVVVPAQAAATGAAVRELTPPADWTARPASLAALLGQTVVDLAWARGVPVLEVAGFADAARTALAEYAPDLIVVSCFPHRLPHAVLALPPHGVLNLHPALLPHGRGPAPLFWTIRHGDGTGGVTVHLMDDGLDSGPIVAQETFPVPDGITGAELELLAAARGAELLARAVDDYVNGRVKPRQQDEAQATVDPWPCAADFVITLDRPARWAFNTIRGTAGWGYPHRIVVAGREFLVRAARGYEPEATLGVPFVLAGDELRVQCTPGVLVAQVGQAGSRVVGSG